MTKIKNKIAYPFDITITDEDYVIGSDGDNLGVTKNYQIGALREYIAQGLSPEAGGTLKIREIAYLGVLLTPSAVLNALVPDLAILQYEVVIVSVNGEKYLLKLQDLTVGAGGTVLVDDNFIKINVNKNIGAGIRVYKGFNSTTGNQEFYTLSSPDFKLEIINNELVIKNPSTSSIAALYVNNLYVPTYDDWVKAGGNLVTNPTFLYTGNGTFSKPYTDSIKYTDENTSVITANSSIQNGLDAYVGDTGTYSRLNPQKIGQEVYVQNNNTGYTYSENFSYSGLILKTEANISCTTIDFVIDMDNVSFFDSTNAVATIETINEAVINLTVSPGFRNSGNTNATDTFATGRMINLFGDGKITSSYNGANVLTQYILNGEGNNNNGNLHYIVKCELQATYQGIYYSKNKNKVDFYNKIQSGVFSGSVNIALKAFRSEGGQIRFFENGEINIASGTSSRTYGITFEPAGLGVGYCIFIINGSIIDYSCRYIFARLNNQNVSLQIRNCLGGGLTAFPLGSNTVVKGVFENLGASKWVVEFKNNNFAFTGIDFEKVDLTQSNAISSVNFIGDNIIESLSFYTSTEAAVSVGLPKGSVFLKRVTVTATSFVVGTEYRIATIGTTDYTSIGATANTVGLYFTATGVGAGTGTVYLETRQVIN